MISPSKLFYLLYCNLIFKFHASRLISRLSKLFTRPHIFDWSHFLFIKPLLKSVQIFNDSNLPNYRERIQNRRGYLTSSCERLCHTPYRPTRFPSPFSPQVEIDQDSHQQIIFGGGVSCVNILTYSRHLFGSTDHTTSYVLALSLALIIKHHRFEEKNGTL